MRKYYVATDYVDMQTGNLEQTATNVWAHDSEGARQLAARQVMKFRTPEQISICEMAIVPVHS